MSAHTPGPWHAHGKTVSTHADNAKGWKAVAVTWRAGNAQLIAAAPDLLAALAAAEDVLSRIAHEGAVRHPPAIRAAIARARGDA